MRIVGWLATDVTRFSTVTVGQRGPEDFDQPGISDHAQYARARMGGAIRRGLAAGPGDNKNI